jgi:hypothetical protein
MQNVLTDRELRQADFDAGVNASAQNALRLKRHGYEQRAVADGNSVTATGRMLTMVKMRFKGAFAFLTGSSSVLTQLVLSDTFSNNANIGNVWSALKDWTSNFSTPVNVETTHSPTEIVQEFTMEAACANVIAELRTQELAFEADLETEVKSVFHEAGEFIGPLQELGHVHAELEHKHGLKQVFHENGTCTYAHCADKVADLKAAFASSNAESPSISSPSHRVMVYNAAANADSVAPMHEPNARRGLGIEAPHLQPTACPA